MEKDIMSNTIKVSDWKALLRQNVLLEEIGDAPNAAIFTEAEVMKVSPNEQFVQFKINNELIWRNKWTLNVVDILGIVYDQKQEGKIEVL